MNSKATAKFDLGQIEITHSGCQRAPATERSPSCPARHAKGDWGDLDETDRDENEYSLLADCRLLSAYQTEDGQKFWIITEADRSLTTVLLPENY